MMANAAEPAAALPSATTQPMPSPVIPPSPCDCDTDPVAGLKGLFVDYFQGLGMAAGRDPATRPVFLRLHGAAHGTFEVRSDLPAEFRVGLFARGASYPTWVRFSSDLQPGLPDVSGTMGVALKLFDVGGRKSIDSDPDAPTHDFIFQNHDVFFADTAKDMCAFTCENLHGRGDEYLKQHPTTDEILRDMAKKVPSVLETPYWSALPFKFGNLHAKYQLVPVDIPSTYQPADDDDAFYLRADLVARLRNGPARFHFLVQLQTNDQDMPLDQATVRWREEVSPPVHVGTLTLPAQDLETRGQSNYGEALAFNIWRALPEHSPVGSLAEARKAAYQASASNRRNVNGQTLGEPTEPRPPEYQKGVPYPAANEARVVRAAVHPGTGGGPKGGVPGICRPPAQREGPYPG